MVEDKERFLAIEQRGIKNTNDIIETNQRTKSNTHRIDKLEKNVQELQKETSVLGEVSAVLKMQTEINIAQTKQMDKLNETLHSQTQNLTELNLITKQLQEDQKARNSKKFGIEDIGNKIFWGLIAVIPSLVLAYIVFKMGW